MDLDGDGVATLLLLNPTGGVLAGDRLETEIALGPGSRVCLSTPSATRVYRSPGPVAVQRVTMDVGRGAALEWRARSPDPVAGRAAPADDRDPARRGRHAALPRRLGDGPRGARGGLGLRPAGQQPPRSRRGRAAAPGALDAWRAPAAGRPGRHGGLRRTSATFVAMRPAGPARSRTGRSLAGALQADGRRGQGGGRAGVTTLGRGGVLARLPLSVGARASRTSCTRCGPRAADDCSGFLPPACESSRQCCSPAVLIPWTGGSGTSLSACSAQGRTHDLDVPRLGRPFGRLPPAWLSPGACRASARCSRRTRTGSRTPAAVLRELYATLARRGNDHVWIHVLPLEDALRQLEAAEGRRRAGAALPLFGVPFAVKDNIDVAGHPTTAGCPAFAYKPETTATVVAPPAGGRGDPGGQDEPRPVRDRPHRHAIAVRRAVVRVRSGLHRGRLELRLGGGGGRAPGRLRARHRHRGLRTRARRLQRHRGAQAHAGLREHGGRDAGLPLARLRVDPRARRWRTPRGCSTWPAAPMRPIRTRASPAAPPAPLGAGFRFGVPAAAQREFFGDEAAPRLYERALERLETLGGRRVTIDLAPFRAAADLLYAGPWVAERLAALGPFFDAHPGGHSPGGAVHRRPRVHDDGGGRLRRACTVSRTCAARRRPSGRAWTCSRCRRPGRSTGTRRSRPTRSGSTAISATTRTS